MDIKFDSDFCTVTYEKDNNVVLLVWKKFCSFDDYRQPTMFASNLLRQYENSNFVIDARNGFEDDKADVEWGFTTLLPHMAKSTCKKCIFIVTKVPQIEEELDMWTKEFMKYFEVSKVNSYEEACHIVKESN